MADRQDDAARQILLGLREANPEDAEINLRLARLHARGDDLAGAVRYYQNALSGVWTAAGSARREVRIELIQYLLAHDQRGRALAELLVLTANLSDDAAAQTEAGQLYLKAGEPRRALDHFQRALERDPRHPEAVTGAGEAAFEGGLTSVFMIFEITQDYQILLPLMVANLLSFMISRRFQPTPVYHALLHQDHVHLPSPAVRLAPTRWTAADVMSSDVTIVPPDVSVQGVWETVHQDGAHGYVIGLPDRLIGVISADRLATARQSAACSSQSVRWSRGLPSTRILTIRPTSCWIDSPRAAESSPS